MVNLYVMQVEQGWIKLEQVPARYRERVKALLKLADIPTDEGN